MNIDDKTLIAQYAANEILRINERLKEMVESNIPPSDEVRESVIGDIETTLSRLQRALSQIQIDDIDDDSKEEKPNA